MNFQGPIQGGYINIYIILCTRYIIVPITIVVFVYFLPSRIIQFFHSFIDQLFIRKYLYLF